MKISLRKEVIIFSTFCSRTSVAAVPAYLALSL